MLPGAREWESDRSSKVERVLGMGTRVNSTPWVRIVSASPIFRAGATALLRGRDGIGGVTDSATADVHVVDGESGSAGAGHVLQSTTVVSMRWPDGVAARRLVRAGARGIVGTNCGGDELVAAVRAVAAGRYHLPAELLDQLIRAPQPVGADLPHAFTVREAEVAGLLSAGRSTTTIATMLGVSVRTVKFHLTNVYAKLGVRNRGDALLFLAEPVEREYRL